MGVKWLLLGKIVESGKQDKDVSRCAVQPRDDWCYFGWNEIPPPRAVKTRNTHKDR